MDPRRTQLLAEVAQDATLERSDFVVRATEQLRRFLTANADRIDDLGGLVLIDDEPDYLSIAPDLSFRSRTRYRDEAGEWVSETEVIESVGELVELYNVADVLAAFIEAARDGELDAEDDEAEEGEGRGPAAEADPYAGAANDWAAGQATLDADDEASAAARLYDLALDFQVRSQQAEARLLSQFETSASNLATQLGEFVVVDDDEQRLLLTGIGALRAEVLAEDDNGSQTWRALESPDALVEYYDPTDIFGDLADALADAYPAIDSEAGREAIETAAEPDADDEAADGEDDFGEAILDDEDAGDDEDDADADDEADDDDADAEGADKDASEEDDR